MKNLINYHLFSFLMFLGFVLFTIMLLSVGKFNDNNVRTLLFFIGIIPSMIFAATFQCIIKNYWLSKSPFNDDFYRYLLNLSENYLQEYSYRFIKWEQLEEIAQKVEKETKMSHANIVIDYSWCLTAVIIQKQRKSGILPKESYKWLVNNSKKFAIIDYA